MICGTGDRDCAICALDTRCFKVTDTDRFELASVFTTIQSINVSNPTQSLTMHLKGFTANKRGDTMKFKMFSKHKTPRSQINAKEVSDISADAKIKEQQKNQHNIEKQEKENKKLFEFYENRIYKEIKKHCKKGATGFRYGIGYDCPIYCSGARASFEPYIDKIIAGLKENEFTVYKSHMRFFDYCIEVHWSEREINQNENSK